MYRNKVHHNDVNKWHNINLYSLITSRTTAYHYKHMKTLPRAKGILFYHYTTSNMNEVITTTKDETKEE